MDLEITLYCFPYLLLLERWMQKCQEVKTVHIYMKSSLGYMTPHQEADQQKWTKGFICFDWTWNLETLIF